MTDVHIENIIAKPGVNVVTLATDEFVTVKVVPTPVPSVSQFDTTDISDNTVAIDTVSFIVESISIAN